MVIHGLILQLPLRIKLETLRLNLQHPLRYEVEILWLNIQIPLIFKLEILRLKLKISLKLEVAELNLKLQILVKIWRDNTQFFYQKYYHWVLRWKYLFLNIQIMTKIRWTDMYNCTKNASNEIWSGNTLFQSSNSGQGLRWQYSILSQSVFSQDSRRQ